MHGSFAIFNVSMWWRFSTPCMGHLLYLIFRCDGDVMENLDFRDFWASKHTLTTTFPNRIMSAKCMRIVQSAHGRSLCLLQLGRVTLQCDWLDTCFVGLLRLVCVACLVPLLCCQLQVTLVHHNLQPAEGASSGASLTDWQALNRSKNSFFKRKS